MRSQVRAKRIVSRRTPDCSDLDRYPLDVERNGGLLQPCKAWIIVGGRVELLEQRNIGFVGVIVIAGRVRVQVSLMRVRKMGIMIAVVVVMSVVRMCGVQARISPCLIHVHVQAAGLYRQQAEQR